MQVVHGWPESRSAGDLQRRAGDLFLLTHRNYMSPRRCWKSRPNEADWVGTFKIGVGAEQKAGHRPNPSLRADCLLNPPPDNAEESLGESITPSKTTASRGNAPWDFHAPTSHIRLCTTPAPPPQDTTPARHRGLHNPRAAPGAAARNYSAQPPRRPRKTEPSARSVGSACREAAPHHSGRHAHDWSNMRHLPTATPHRADPSRARPCSGGDPACQTSTQPCTTAVTGIFGGRTPTHPIRARSSGACLGRGHNCPRTNGR